MPKRFPADRVRADIRSSPRPRCCPGPCSARAADTRTAAGCGRGTRGRWRSGSPARCPSPPTPRSPSAHRRCRAQRSAAAVAHARRQEQPAPVAHLLGAAVRLRHALVVVDRVERREPRVADAVKEDQLAAVARERVQVGPPRRRRSALRQDRPAPARPPRSTSIPIGANAGRPGSARRAAGRECPAWTAMPVSNRKPG